ncbi:MAG TPA: dicarboxylate/amino acid:cation symporter [Methylophilaceae bacterium]|nr:dicarboxylate/amino acid:cation symporter [Methylophilaceae bacterium]
MRWLSLNAQIFMGTALGVLIGWGMSVAPDTPVREGILYTSDIVGGLFIDLLKMVLIPLVFTSIAVGVANLQAHKQIHRVWITTLIFFAATSMLAVSLALIVSNIVKPGAGLDIAMFQGAMRSFQVSEVSLPQFFAHFLHSLFQNPFAALAESNVLAVLIFALLVGIALVIGGERYRNILQLLQEVLEMILRIVGWIMRLAPFGIMALLIKLVATQDTAVLGSLGTFVTMVVGTTLFHGVIILPMILYVITGMTPLRFWLGAREALITAFATSSSSATLPVTLRCVEQHLHVKREAAGFVVPLGATVNMDGTALYEAAAALFVANLVGIELNLVQQLIVFFTAMIAAVGAPGIPSAGMVTMVMVLQSVGLPAEAIAILLPIDRMLDTLRTAVNVEGDMIGSVVVQKLVKS